MSPSTDAQSDSANGRRGGRRYMRHAVRAGMLVACVLLLLSAGGESRLAVAVPAASPLATVASLLASGTFQATAWIGLSVAALVLVRHRMFCRWVCPTGTCADCCAIFRRGRRRAKFSRAKLPRLGQWIAMLTLGGAALGYPVVMWFDPLAFFSGMFGVFHTAVAPAAAWCALGMAGVAVLSVVRPGAWCSRVCPLGAFQDILFRFSLTLRRIFVGRRKRGARRATAGLTRRVALAALTGAVWGAVARGARAAARPLLRPPGAIDEARFTGLCTRCGNCLRACPVDIIRPTEAEGGIAGLLTPTLDFSGDYCREDCTRCTQVCPSGALTPMTKRDKPQAAIGLPQVDMEVCLLGDDRECFICRSRCPYEAIKLEFCEVEYTLTPRIDADKCPGCGACETACPTVPTKAIVIRPR